MTRRRNGRYVLVFVIGGLHRARCRVGSQDCGFEMALVATRGLLDLRSYVDL